MPEPGENVFQTPFFNFSQHKVDASFGEEGVWSGSVDGLNSASGTWSEQATSDEGAWGVQQRGATKIPEPSFILGFITLASLMLASRRA